MKKLFISVALITSGLLVFGQKTNSTANSSNKTPKRVPFLSQKTLYRPQYPANHKMINVSSVRKDQQVATKGGNTRLIAGNKSSIIIHPIRLPDRNLVVQNRKKVK